MLSRIAESLFWIGRYVERADVTARILEVQTEALVENPTASEEASCRMLLDVMGVAYDGPLDRRELMRLMVYDEASDASVASTLAAARESARRARETLPTEMWAAINMTWRAIQSGRISSMRSEATFAWLRERTAVIAGIADSTMSRDEGWHFLVLGRSIERADMTARLLTSTTLTGGPAGGWVRALRACGAHEAFLRTYRGLETEREAAEFLLLDRLFPRSLVSALTSAELCLEELESSGQRAGFSDEAQRLLGRARAGLEYRPLPDILARLPKEMESLQLTCTGAAEAVATRYFATAEAISWAGGIR